MFTLHNLLTDNDRRIVETMVAAHPTPGVRMRPPEQVALAVGTGQSYLVRRDGEPCACSLLYKYDCRAADGRIYSEIGTQLVLEEGYGLQILMAKLHLLQVHVEEHGEDLNAVFAVVSPGTASEHNLRLRVGMEDWAVPGPLGHERGRAGVRFDPAKSTMVAGADALPRAIGDLSAWLTGDRLLATPKRGAQVRCDLGWFVPAALERGE